MTAPVDRDAAAEVHVEVLGQLDADDVSEVAALVERVTETDGVRPLSEHVMLHLRYGGDQDVRNVLVRVGADLAAYGHLDVTDEVEGASAELTVDPAHRRAGLGTLLVRTTLGETSDGRLRLWAHGEHPAAAAMAKRLGFRRSRSLWQMRRSLFAPLPAPDVPAGVDIRTFRPGTDDDAWVALNALAFRDHPEQGQWTPDDLHRRMREPWFDPHGFFLAWRADGSHDDRLVGFHWTKVHGGNGHDHPPENHGHGHEPIGEVYVVGVHPDERGTGLGRALTIEGLRHLRHLGLPQAMLYVEADNVAAIRLYTRLDFTRWETDVMIRRDPSAPEPQ